MIICNHHFSFSRFRPFFYYIDIMDYDGREAQYLKELVGDQGDIDPTDTWKLFDQGR